MGKNTRVWAAGIAVLLAIAACAGYLATRPSKPSPPPATASVAVAPAPPAAKPKPHVFTPAELNAFLTAAANAEAITDPLKRCLAYPDPPSSHWNAAAVSAYCRYRTQPIITADEVRSLIEHGQAAELDRRLGDSLQAQLTQPDAVGRLDRTFFADFNDGSLDQRYLLDAWKRASPDSAFAYAASGFAYVQMAIAARGGDYASKTPQDNMDSMQRLLTLADADLQKARKLDPRITPIYTAMVQAGGYALGERYAERALHDGLQQDPANFAIYGQYIWIAQPQWLGSLEDLQHAVDQGLQHARQNPLLRLKQAEVAEYTANIHGWRGDPVRVEDFPAVFDQAADAGPLGAAGRTAAEHGQPAMAAIYLSEAIRFNSDDASARRQLARLAGEQNQPALVMLHAGKLLAEHPDDAELLTFRGWASMQLGKVAEARADLVRALEKNPDNGFAMSLLASLYVYSTREWDKGWALSDRLIAQYPDHPDGWRLRASIQLRQPRAGLDDTLHYFILHFGNDPSQRSVVRQMRGMLKAEAKGGDDPLKPFRG